MDWGNFMKKPRNITIHGQKVDIKYVDLSQEDYDGACNVDKKLIVLHSGLSGDAFTYSYLHECFHYLFSRLSLDQCIDGNVEEIIVDGFSKYVAENYNITLKK
jgi:hypothetical protein